GHLTIELGERIGGGRSAVVYAATVVTATPREDGAPWTKDPFKLELCVKVARPNRCRSLAREGWMYEQLTENALQGVITPRCYGFFTAELARERAQFPLWSSDDFDLDRTPGDRKSDDPTCDDPLLDDDEEDDADDANSTPGGRELSPWLDWRPRPDAPLLSVLVMARGGSKYSVDEDEWDEEAQQDILQVLDDLALSYIVINDLRPPNIIHAPHDTRKCGRHKCVHKWNLVDFAWSIVDDPKTRNKAGFLRELQRNKYRCPYFYTGRR
ncbi:uncharacterized protein B0H18DRAFT_119547, partial [Fomitopsis serialis]|uniref:uncharacterized protein n=1 Tax=Fomitopsis serialis TaxID=139415 RepID=UPI002007CCDC